MKRTTVLGTLLVMLLTATTGCDQCCKTNHEAAETDSVNTVQPTVVDDTIHSAVLNRTIHLQREAIELASLRADDSSKAYIVFAPDSLTVELFVPNESVVLDRRTNGESRAVWNVEDDDTYQVEQKDGRWHVSRRYTDLYEQASAE